MSIGIERLIPLIVGTAAGAAYLVGCAAFPGFILNVDMLLSDTVTVGAVMVGFIATAKAIVVAWPDAHLRKEMVESGFIRDYAGYLVAGIRWGFAMIILGLTLQGVALYPLLPECILGAVWLFTTAGSLTACWRACSILTRLLRLVR